MIERLHSLKPRERNGLIVVAVVLFLLVADNLIYRPLAVRCRALDRQIGLEMEQVQLDGQTAALQDAVDAAYRDVTTLLGEPMEVAAAIDQMKGEIDRLAKESNVLLRSMKHLEPTAAGAYNIYTVYIAGFEADEASLLRFLHALRHRGGTFRVTRLSIGPDETATSLRGSLLITKVMAPPPAPRG